MSVLSFENLYKLDSKGKLRVWFMELDGSKHRTVSGVHGGSFVESEWTECKPKNVGRSNETTGAQQAKSEIESRYEKQLKTGYYKDVPTVDTEDSLFDQISPMLAKNYKDQYKKVKLDGTWGAQCKFNGARCKATKTGLYTRKAEVYLTCPHIHSALSDFFVRFPTAHIDGELFNDAYKQRLNDMMSLINKKNVTQEDLDAAEQIVRYYVYDFYDESYPALAKDTPYQARKAFIESELQSQYVIHVPTFVPTSQDELESYYADLTSAGQEGIILRNLLGPYEQKRSSHLLKMKPEDDAEAVITDIQPGSGNWAGKAKVISLRMPDGREFNGTFKGTMPDAIEMLANSGNWIGKTVTFTYNGLTGLGIPNYAQVNYRNCIKE